MFEKVVRFDRDVDQPAGQWPTAAHVQDGRTKLIPARPAPLYGDEAAGLAQLGSAEPAWIWRMLENQTALFEYAQRERALAVAELARIAQVLCKDAWDGQSRSGTRPEQWPPKMTADMVINTVNAALRNVRLSQDPALPEKYHQMAAELANARAEVETLRQRALAAEEIVRDMKALAVRQISRRQGAAEKGVATTPAASRLRREGHWHDRPQDSRAGAREQPPAGASEEAARGSDDRWPDRREIAIPEATPAQVGSSNARVDDLVRLIAEYGLCRWKDISAQLAQQWGKRLTSGAMDNAISKAISFGLLRAEEVQLEWGGRPTGKMLVLTEAGARCAVSLGVRPVESQFSRGLSAHKDGAHFYVILEAAGILATRYASVDCFPSYMVIRGEKHYPDITAIDSDGRKIGIEVERGTYKAQRDGKWLRAAAANEGVVYLVTPNQEVMLAIAAEIDRVREYHPGSIRRILAFNVRSYRDNKGRGDDSGSLWSYEG